MKFLNREKRIAKAGKKEAGEIYSRFKKRDFSGNTGQAIKNSTYQLTTTLIAKFGSLIFTIILARMLMPDLFGLYSLALSTILIFAAFSDLGIGAALITFVSEKLGNKDYSKAKSYVLYLAKWKLVLNVVASFVLFFSAYFVANFYYNKPIFFALLAGCLYLPAVIFVGFMEGIFQASNNFKFPLIKEIFFQLVRITLIPITILYLLSPNVSISLFYIFLSLTICYFLTLILELFLSSKFNYLRKEFSPLNFTEKNELNKFLIPLAAMALSGTFFGYIDTIMLGHYVTSEFIGYYSSALALIGSALAIIGFSAAATFPIFSRLRGDQLSRGFKKTLLATALIAILASMFTFVFSKQIILLIYGKAYLSEQIIFGNTVLASSFLLKLFSILIIIQAFSGLYQSFYVSQKHTKRVSFLLIFSTILNIFLNWLFISKGIQISLYAGAVGACVATIISRGIYLMGLVWFKNIFSIKKFKS